MIIFRDMLPCVYLDFQFELNLIFCSIQSNILLMRGPGRNKPTLSKDPNYCEPRNVNTFYWN